MSAPRSIRFEPHTLARLAAYAARHPGMSSASAAALLVEEGLRMNEHPGITFREGPTGRRAALVGGPDVWEVIKVLRDARRAEPRLSRARLIAVVCATTSLVPDEIQTAVDYYGAFADELDAEVAAADHAEVELERSLKRTQHLLGS